MRIKSIVLSLLACIALAALSQPVQHANEWEWYLDEVVNDVFVGRNYFEIYYSPSAADIKQQRERGEVTYFLNSPEGLNSKKVRDMIDRLMGSYDDIKAVSDWHMTNTTYWKEFRYEKNKFHFNVKRKALDDGTYYVSVTETADFYKSLGKKKQSSSEDRIPVAKEEKPARDKARRDRKPVVIPDETVNDVVVEDEEMADDDPVPTSNLSAKEQRKIEAEEREAKRQALRVKQRREQEQQREQAKAEKEAKKEAQKVKKAEEKKQKEEEKRLKKEEQKRRQEQEQQERLQARRDREEQRRQAAAPKPVASKYHYTDVALWLSEKYDFTQTSDNGTGTTMYSTAVKDLEMAKLAIKNALKGSNARMAVPWRLNNDTGLVETGYTVDGHVLIFAIGTDADGRTIMTITEVSGDEFEQFKQSLNGN